jgi:hypothetical protein
VDTKFAIIPAAGIIQPAAGSPVLSNCTVPPTGKSFYNEIEGNIRKVALNMIQSLVSRFHSVKSTLVLPAEFNYIIDLPFFPLSSFAHFSSPLPISACNGCKQNKFSSLLVLP